ncbi:MAG: two component transcriptional regulator, LuxR family [Verrucomicrobiales bacterium]|nr:two component transcriptional regulator, LuxR family [Verrucomicrobiales bacterium]
MKRILIIEDEPAMRANLREMLEMEGFQPQLAANGREGLATARSLQPDLILCDVLMPELDGHGVLSALRSDPATAQIPFVFLTAKGEHQDVRTGMNLGADDYLIKPVRIDDLLAAIEARLERAQQRTNFNANFDSATPLEGLGISPREAEILLWIAQGKTNFEAGIILKISGLTVKKHLEHIYEKLSVEGRNGATLKALEVLSNLPG